MDGFHTLWEERVENQEGEVLGLHAQGFVEELVHQIHEGTELGLAFGKEEEAVKINWLFKDLEQIFHAILSMPIGIVTYVSNHLDVRSHEDREGIEILKDESVNQEQSFFVL